MAKLIATFTLILSLLFGHFGSVPALRADDAVFKAVLVADTHADADPVRDRMDVLRECFAGIEKSAPDSDCLVLAGDITNSGDLREYTWLQNVMNAYCGRIGTRLPELGNHDSWHHSDDPDYAGAVRNFKAFCLMNGVRTEKVYYRKDVCGVPFIMLGAAAADFGEMLLTEEQLRWLDEQLAQACALNTPVFVICHKPLGSIGECAGALERILKARAKTAAAPIIYVSGHRHELGGNTFKRAAKNLIYLNLPSLQYTEGGGLGFIAEITELSVTLRGMDFIKGEPLGGYTYTVKY